MIKRYHVCEVLKDFTRDLYYYDKTDWLDNIFFYLDYVLVCNQHITNTFTHILMYELTPPVFYKEYPKGLFPEYLRRYDNEIIKNNIDKINSEIDKIQPKKPALVASNFSELISLSKFDLLNLKIPYSEIISILKYINNPMVERAEYGYYIGALLTISVNNFLKKHETNSNIWIQPDWKILLNRIKNYRKDVFFLEKKRGLNYEESQIVFT